jgi:hypothetical protein
MNMTRKASVGHKTNLLRQWDNGSYFLSFSLHGFAMRLKIEKPELSFSHSVRYDRYSRTAS